jgi:hypothetical protein
MNRKKYQHDPDLARRIRDAGIPIPVDEDGRDAPHDPPSGLLMYRDGARGESFAFNFNGGAGYVIKLVITVNLSHFAISEFDIELPWEGYVRWIDDPVAIGGRTDVYRFSADYPLTFERDEVLNHRVGVQRMWPRSNSLKGYLLGVGHVPIPDEFKLGAKIPALVIVRDQFFREHKSPISLSRDRTMKPVRRVWEGAGRKGRLFDHLDPGFEGAHLENKEEAKK